MLVAPIVWRAIEDARFRFGWRVGGNDDQCGTAADTAIDSGSRGS